MVNIVVVATQRHLGSFHSIPPDSFYVCVCERACACANFMAAFPYPTYLLRLLRFGFLFVFLLTLVGLLYIFHPIREKERSQRAQHPIISDDRGVESMIIYRYDWKQKGTPPGPTKHIAKKLCFTRHIINDISLITLFWWRWDIFYLVFFGLGSFIWRGGGEIIYIYIFLLSPPQTVNNINPF
jgi:hypothetical protein